MLPKTTVFTKSEQNIKNLVPTLRPFTFNKLVCALNEKKPLRSLVNEGDQEWHLELTTGAKLSLFPFFLRDRKLI